MQSTDNAMLVVYTGHRIRRLAADYAYANVAIQTYGNIEGMYTIGCRRNLPSTGSEEYPDGFGRK